MDIFRFKRFSISQPADAGMRVGTDGVLIGAWCRIEDGQRRMLDVGTGTGLIALMLAQRAPWAAVDAIDISAECCRIAADNAATSPFAGQVSVICRPVQELCAAPYDHIVSNPPYFTESLLPPCEARTAARHTATLQHGELLGSVAGLLSPGGRFSVILPTDAALRMQDQAPGHGLHLQRADELLTREGLAPKRIMAEYALTPNPIPQRGVVTIHDPSGEYTEQYRALTRDFYLKF